MTVDSLSNKYKDELISLTYHYQLAADPVKFDPIHCYLGEGFGNIASYPNLGYQVDRSSPQGVILGSSYAEALADVEQHFDFSEVPCGLNIVHNWNSGTRKISGEIKVNFDSFPASGEYRIMFVVVQDSINFKQYDYGMSGDFGVPYVEPSIGYLDTFYHNHVVRDGIIDGDKVWGEVFTTDPSNGESFNISFNYTLPEKYEFSGPGTITIPSKYDPEKVEDEHITLVAFISRNKSEVVNAAKADLIDDSTPIQKSFKAIQNVSNLDFKNGILFNCNNKMRSLEIFNLSGKKMKTIKNFDKINLNEIALSKGHYLLKVKFLKSESSITKEWIKF